MEVSLNIYILKWPVVAQCWQAVIEDLSCHGLFGAGISAYCLWLWLRVALASDNGHFAFG